MRDQYRELLIGCGHSREKRLDPRDFLPQRVPPPPNIRTWRGVLETLDYMIECRPDYVCNLNRVPWSVCPPAEYADDQYCNQWCLADSIYDEVHAYEVLEHLGRQGDFRSFFDTFGEIWRILKPGGYLCATVPSRYDQGLWGDPGHCRAILPMSLVFLSQPQYDAQMGKTSMSDYRRVYRADFDTVGAFDDHVGFRFVLQCVKPARLTVS